MGGGKGTSIQDAVESSIPFEANFEANFEDAFAAAMDNNQAPAEQSSTASGSSNRKHSLEENDDDSKEMMDCNDVQPPVPKHVVGGRASIPEELDSNQLARLQNLKESNA